MADAFDEILAVVAGCPVCWSRVAGVVARVRQQQQVRRVRSQRARAARVVARDFYKALTGKG